MDIKKLAVVLISLVLLTGASLIIADEDRPEGMPEDVPDEDSRDMDIQVAHNDDEIFFRTEWEREEGNWYHDYFVYEDGEWERRGYTEDRLSVLLDDGNVDGFKEYGGWLTAHDWTRSMTDHPDEDEIEEIFPGEDDMRKYIPHSREGENWWEGEWDEVRDDIDEMKDEGEFLDLWHVRTHRSVPIGYGDSQHVLDYRYGDHGDSSYDSRSLEEQPDYMFDPDIVEDGTLNWEDIEEKNLPQDQSFEEYYEDGEWTHEYDPYYIHEDWVVEFDPDVAEEEGAAIPRRVLREPTESRGVVEADALYEEDTWDVEFSRALDTGYEDDNVISEENDNSIAFGIHDAVSQRYHFTSFGYELELGEEGEDFTIDENDEIPTIVAEHFEGEEPDWDEIGEPETMTLPYPGLTSWQWVKGHIIHGQDYGTPDETSLWEAFHGPESLGELAYEMEVEYWETDVEVEYLQVNGQSDEVTVGLDQEVEITAEAEFPMHIPKPIELRVEDEDGEEVHSWEYGVSQTEEIERSNIHGDVWSEGEYTVILGEEEVAVTVAEDPPEIEVDDLTVNGEPDEVQVGLDESVTITAEVSNVGGASTDVPLIVEGADDEVGHKGYVLEDLGPGEEESIEWTADEHATWEEGVYTVRIEDESVEVTVGDPVVDPDITANLEVNGEEDEVTIDEDDEVEIDVSIENDGETEETVELYVLEDDDPIAPHDPYETYTVPAGGSEEDTLTHDHVSDWEGEFYARLIQEDTEDVLAEVDVTVGDPDVDPVDDDPDWESLRILIGIALATFIVGIGVGLLYERKIKREK